MWAQFRFVALQICCGCKSPLALGAFLVLIFGTQQTFACSCETDDQPRKDAREYYTKIFDGAIFTGTIMAISDDPESTKGGITMTELSVEVDEYWVGVTKKDLTVLVYGPGNTCSTEWKVGTKTFFIASRYNGRLYRALCEIANWGGYFPDANWKEYTYKTLGQSKTFRKMDVEHGSDHQFFSALLSANSSLSLDL